MWTPGAGGGRSQPVSFDDKPVGKPPPSMGGGGGMMGGGGGFAAQPKMQPTSVKVKRSTAADNFYKQAQRDGGHRVAKKSNAAKQTPGMPPKRPNFLMCYLCGQQFGKASLPIHQPQCFMKKLVEWERGDPATRGAQPVHPDEMAEKIPAVQDTSRMTSSEIDAYNDAQFQHFNDNMVSCENCGRTFFPERLAVHQRSCRPDASGRGSKPVNGKTNTTDVVASQQRSASPPIRGGAGSYTLPEEDEQLVEDIPIRPQKKIAAPPPSPSLEPCPQCGRRFVPKKLEAHMAVCKGPSPAGMSATGAPRTGPGGNPLPTFEESLMPCQYCARTFAPDRLSKHESVCPSAKLGGNPPPARPVTQRKSSVPATTAAPSPASTLPAVGGKPKFCQECGTKFTTVPKFCQECGTRI
eukprot:TRINITY_DN2531_c0_g2_i1.p1 TRINITY_DN2531_c0_g2~~TRINITY_DN2531_c0_g2_i1.p1  ORF type:complete len:426 (+),score=32.78 TRINITY_DN2531_c0_g2_i1:53-1279(+)